MENRKPNTTCTECNKPIYRRPFQLEKGLVYCSHKCAHIKTALGSIPCKVCKKPIERRKHALTCSRKCANISRYGATYGQGQQRSLVTYKERLREKLFAIRPKKCNRCPYDKIDILQIHHIIERCNGGTDKLDNLEILCPNCHTEHHFVKNKLNKILV